MKPKRFFAVMGINDFSTIELPDGQRLKAPSKGPHGFIPVFNSRRAAERFAKGKFQVVEVESVFVGT